jgi:ribosomal-protein-alanine N-acetyltransferase
LKTELNTERLCLRLVDTPDATFIMELVNTKGWLQFIGNRNINSKEEAERYIDKLKATENLFYWVVRIKDTCTPTGIISFLKRDYLEHFDIGFAFLPQYSGNGYAYEAAHNVLLAVKEDPKYSTVLATTIPENMRSIKLLEKLLLKFDKEIQIGEQTLHIYST